MIFLLNNIPKQSENSSFDAEKRGNDQKTWFYDQLDWLITIKHAILAYEHRLRQERAIFEQSLILQEEQNARKEKKIR